MTGIQGETLLTRNPISLWLDKWNLGVDWQIRNGQKLPLSYFEKNAAADLMMDLIDFDAPIRNAPNARRFDFFYDMPASLDQPPFSVSRQVHFENKNRHCRSSICFCFQLCRDYGFLWAVCCGVCFQGRILCWPDCLLA